jgi:hypothetical protein
MHLEDESETGSQDQTHMEAETDGKSQMVDVTPSLSSTAKNRRSKAFTVAADDASADTAQAGEANLHQQKLTGKDRTNQVRYDIKFHVSPSKEADKTMIAAAKKFFAKAKEMDDSIVIYPWFKSSKSSKIQETRLIPETMGAFKTFFHQAQPRVAGGFVYMRVWLGHNKDTETLKDDLQWWMNNQQFGLYPRSVQAENISVIGWLLYSTRDVNCASLQTALERRFKRRYEVGCRYRMISLGRRGAIPKDEQVKAIHIECDSAVQFELKEALSKIYASAKNDDYPNGIRMRLVPEINSMISPDTRQNVSRLKARQANFQAQIMSAISWDIEALDFVDHVIGWSLRDLIMKIESRTNPGNQLFHLVDATWNGNGYHFAFFPNVEAEARAMMMALIPFMTHFYKDTALKWFSASAQRRALGALWDPEKGCVKTSDDEAVAWMMTEDGFVAFDKANAGAKVTVDRPDPSNLQVSAGAGLINDQDSVGTFDPQAAEQGNSQGPRAQLVTGSKANSTPRVLPSSSDSGSVDTRSTRSSITASIFSRLSTMEGTLSKVDELSSLMNLIANQMGIPVANPSVPNTNAPITTPNNLPETVTVQVAAAVNVTQPEFASASQSANMTLLNPDGVRPLTYEGTLSPPSALPEIRQSQTDQASAGASSTDAGPAG